MHSEEKLQRIRERAYEIYIVRDPNQGSAEEDWWRAEQEIEREEEIRVVPCHGKPTRWRELLIQDGRDIENPT